MFVPVVALVGLAVLMILPLPDERGVAVGAACIAAVVVLWLVAAIRRQFGAGRSASPGDVHRRARVARRT